MVHAKKGDLETAEKIFQKIVTEINTGYAPAYYERAICLHALGKLNEATDCYSSFLDEFQDFYKRSGVDFQEVDSEIIYCDCVCKMCGISLVTCLWL